MSYKEKYQRWLSSCAVDAETKVELKCLSENEIEDRFYSDLEFGTGGLRGVMAAGTNRMNVYTVRLATQGLANEILDCSVAKEKGVVIAFDSRNNSELFAKECARVLCANDIKTYIFEGLRPTPELSFAVRYLGCARGVVITASHNPKEYNGYKVYGEDGAQIAPETAKKIIGYINNTDIFDDIRLCDNNKSIIIGEDVDRAYIEAIKGQAFGINIPDDFKVVYTPLHGSGNFLVRRVLSEIGVKNVLVVPEQELPDGDFPTVESPNPENFEAFTLAVEYAKEQTPDIIFGTDPDSDRIGVVVRSNNGEYIPLNGNETGCLLCEFILKKLKEKQALDKNGAIVKTIVTTESVREIANSYEIETIDVLTGFKFIGEKIKEFEADKKRTFIFGLEESYGYLKGTYARDKDAVVAAMLVCEMAACYKSKGMTLYDGLKEIYRKYGYFSETLMTKTLVGIDGIKQISKIMHKFRTENLPINVIDMVDYNLGIAGLPKADVIKFFTSDGWLAVRPSGTEPKIKFYFGVKSKASKEDADTKLHTLKNTIVEFLN